MSADAIASWLQIRQHNSKPYNFQEKTRVRPSLDETKKPTGNATLASRQGSKALSHHHRIFWGEETTSTSLWEGTGRAIKGVLESEGRKAQISPPSDNSDDTKRHQHQHQEHELSSSTNGDDEKNMKNQSQNPAATLRKISDTSDLERLSRVLDRREVNTSCRETFAAAVRLANPAIVDMWLRHGKEHGGSSFLQTFRLWWVADETAVTGGGGGGSPASLPLHMSCHAGSPGVVSVLLQFTSASFPSEDLSSMVNARDLNGRTALHLASWSPRVQCPGKRNAIVRNLLAHGADPNARDRRGRTALHEACRAVDCFAAEIILKGGANPLEEDHRHVTPIETATVRRHRRLLDVAFRRQLSPEQYVRLCARLSAKSTVSKIMRRFEPVCGTCRARSADTCNALRRDNYAAWVYKHQRWPKGGEGERREVRPSCVEKTKVTKTASKLTVKAA